MLPRGALPAVADVAISSPEALPPRLSGSEKTSASMEFQKRSPIIPSSNVAGGLGEVTAIAPWKLGPVSPYWPMPSRKLPHKVDHRRDQSIAKGRVASSPTGGPEDVLETLDRAYSYTSSGLSDSPSAIRAAVFSGAMGKSGGQTSPGRE